MLGWATGLTGGFTYGLYGQADSAAGTGVFGWASDTTGGYTSGVFGETASTAGYGVFSGGDLGATGIKSFMRMRAGR